MITKNELDSKIAELAVLINEKYKGERIVLLGVMNGSFFLMHDLIKKIKVECEYDFLFCSSYYGGLKSKGEVGFMYPEKVNINSKKIIVLEDIVDTGKTISKVSVELLKNNPKSIDIATLFTREKSKSHINFFWHGYKIKNEFIVGYGLDYGEKYRNLEDVCELKID